jgi:hypothetical protein
MRTEAIGSSSDHVRGRFRESDALYRAEGDTLGSAYMQTNLAIVLRARRQYAAAEPLLRECVALCRALGADYQVAVNLGNLAIIAFESGDDCRARSLLEEKLAYARQPGRPPPRFRGTR